MQKIMHVQHCSNTSMQIESDQVVFIFCLNAMKNTYNVRSKIALLAPSTFDAIPSETSKVNLVVTFPLRKNSIFCLNKEEI